MMGEWLSENGQWLAAAITAAVAAGGATAAWFQGRLRQQAEIWQRQLEAETRLAQQREQQLRQELAEQQQELDTLDVERDRLSNELRQMHARLAAAVEKLRYLETLRQEHQALTERLEASRQSEYGLAADLRELQTRYREEQKASHEKIQLLENAETRLQQQFESLANRLFEQKSRSVDAQNKLSLDGLLSPLKEQLEGFRKQINDSFSHEARERHTLVHEINSLKLLNEQMAREAVNLTQALKGDNKAQGNWGEVVLSRVLTESGLREGHEYRTQVNLEDSHGKRYQPDVVVHLPQDKDVVIDAKMSLVAYERYFHAETQVERDKALSEHLTSLRGHIRGLSRKDYHQLHGVRSLDYVLMFIPVEPAFQAAVEADPALIRDAMDSNIMLVSPTTLLVALRTINNLWRNERQNQNARQIAERAGKLYDKLRLFVSDMEQVGGALDKASLSYQGAMNKLASGRGNIIRQAESFKELGVEVKRDLPLSVTERALQDSEAVHGITETVNDTP
ncbi:DNA recombination protein RmuC [Photobacterium sp. GJ3]|nr:DNA recombination protein RmuC [Photobacterium sp. GJ3]QUJ67436.1 DNA recombination protein RmuC [Photobacterium sp. GJ3]